MTAPPGAARFVVTTRPLPPGETARLRGPQVGFYELQPFDDEALARFARNWFDPAGTEEGGLMAAEFLDQVGAAGLGTLLTVPLLATVAARVFELSRDRTLPASQFELYREYIRLFYEARAEALEALRRTPGTGALVGWLDEHRIPLLEALATAHISRETPLLEVLEQKLNDPALEPPRLEVGWEETVIGWLSHTGIVGRYGKRLRFLHQTFAEYLAASAEAKTLPDVFAPDRAPWDDLIRKLLFEDEQAERVFLHYLHRPGPDTGLLHWLQRGTQSQRDRAAELIEQGAPCDEAQLAAHCAFVEAKALAGDWSELQSLAAFTRHRAVRERLDGLYSHTAITPSGKVEILDLLGERTPGVRRQEAGFLQGCTEAGRPPRPRLRAAQVLAKLGGRHHEHAARVLMPLKNSSRSAASRGQPPNGPSRTS